jgi:hypothetical protein
MLDQLDAPQEGGSVGDGRSGLSLGITLTFRQTDGRALRIRKAIVPEQELQQIYNDLEISRS